MEDLSQQRCLNHAHREAVARCPACGRCFCRECITEHDDRVLCASCLNHLLQPRTAPRIRFGTVVQAAQLLGSMLLIWMVFYYLGQILLVIPTSFHEGTLWNAGWWNGQ